MNKLKGFLALLASGLIFGTFGIWIRLLSQELTVYQQIFLRNTIGFIFSLIIVFLLKQKWNFKGIKKLYLFAYTISFPVSVIFFVFAMLDTKIATALFAFYASSFSFSWLISNFIYKDKNSFNKIIGIVLAVIGIIIINFPLSLSSLNIGFIFGFLSGIFDAISNGFRRYLSGKVDRFILVSTQMFGGIVIASLIMLFVRQPLPLDMSLETLGIGLLFGILLMSVAFLTLVGFQNFDVNKGTIIISSELFFGPLFAAIFLKEIPNTKEIIGGAVIMLSIIVSNINLLTKRKTLAALS